MSTFSYQIDLDVPATRAWEVIADFGGVHKYSPGVRASHSTSPRNGGKGATRHCQLKPLGSLDERILEWKEGRGFDLEIFKTKGAPPFEKAVARFEIRDRGATSSVEATVTYRLKGGPIGWVLDQFMVRRFLRRGINGLLGGIKKYAETGEVITSGRGLSKAVQVT